MERAIVDSRERTVLSRSGLQALLDALVGRGYALKGPTIRDGAIVYDTIASTTDLPAGWTDQQDGGRYRLERRPDDALFGFAVGPHSWKRFLHPPVETVVKVRRDASGLKFEQSEPDMPRHAFIGVRSCELHAITIQDRVLCEGPYIDPGYARRRAGAFILAVNCSEAGGTCFCVSMGTGPKARDGYDLALTELMDGDRHEFLVEVGSEAGAEVLAAAPSRPATESDLAAAAVVVQRTASRMGRELRTDGLKELLQGNPEHPQWEKVAERCLSCCNCTMVCPTCFCTTVKDQSDLAGTTAERVRSWDSCFSLDFSYLHGSSVRTSTRARYRQWMTHKLAHWIDQFGTSGCVGCGRCITWCPVGIDITQEAAAIRAAPATNGGEP
jgi:ferredoxin